jgi:hypothetical protein
MKQHPYTLRTRRILDRLFARWMAYDRRHAAPAQEVIPCILCPVDDPHPAWLLLEDRESGSDALIVCYQCSSDEEHFFSRIRSLDWPSYRWQVRLLLWRAWLRKVLAFLLWWLSAQDLSSDSSDEQDDPRACGEDEDEPRLSGPSPRSLFTGIIEPGNTRSKAFEGQVNHE